MKNDLVKSWSAVCLTLSVMLLAKVVAHAGHGVQHADTQIVLWEALGLSLIGVLGIIYRHEIEQIVDRNDQPLIEIKHPHLNLFLISFVALFLELSLIRYCCSQIRIFSFYKNIPLVGAFLGLGIGCFKAEAKAKHLLSLIFWFLPFSAFLSQGSFLIGEATGSLAAYASSEHILGDVIAPKDASFLTIALNQILIGAVCAAVFSAIAVIFIQIGRLLGDAFRQIDRIPGYTINILGSFLGVLMFVFISYLQMPPFVWFLIGLLPLLYWIKDQKKKLMGLVMIFLSVVSIAPSIGNTIWSPYQKLIGLSRSIENSNKESIPVYVVEISDVFYQVALDLSPLNIRRLGKNPFPHYDKTFESISSFDRVLIVGAGTGNDVAAALRAGVKHVDAVDIDPAIVKMGKLYHPEQPYDDPRVRVIINDARAAFRTLPKNSYDAVVFGLLDSHSQLGMSSVRLDNYVFTLESFQAAKSLLKPGGSIIVAAATFRDWFRNRFTSMLNIVCGVNPEISVYDAWSLYRCQPQSVKNEVQAIANHPKNLPTDDWPFLYLPARNIPSAYLVVLGILALSSIGMLKRFGLTLNEFTPLNIHMFFLGAAFLLMEVSSINRLALLFGTTWLVSAVTIACVLLMIILANLTILWVHRPLSKEAYVFLFVSLIVSFNLSTNSALGRGFFVSLLYGLLMLLPIYYAGLIFASSFKKSIKPESALGANILGSVLGGWTEYLVMIIGIRALILVALIFYFISYVSYRFSFNKEAQSK